MRKYFITRFLPLFLRTTFYFYDYLSIVANESSHQSSHNDVSHDTQYEDALPTDDLDYDD